MSRVKEMMEKLIKASLKKENKTEVKSFDIDSPRMPSHQRLNSIGKIVSPRKNSQQANMNFLEYSE